MKCPNCQNEIPETSEFCQECGQGLDANKDPPKTLSAKLNENW